MAPTSMQQQQRALYAAKCLEQITPEMNKKALKSIKSKDQGLKRKTIACLRQHSMVYPPRKRCKPVKYTDDVLQAAYDILADPPEGLYTGPSLLQRLLQDQVLSPPADTDSLLQHLKRFCEAKGHRLYTTYTGTIFLITPATKQQRVRWCHSMQEHLQAFPLQDWIFEDETTIEEQPHPKCEWFWQAALRRLCCMGHVKVAECH